MAKTPEEFHREMADEWKEFRLVHSYTQKKLAEALGVSRRTIQYVERGNQGRPELPCIPRGETVAKFRALKKKLERRK